MTTHLTEQMLHDHIDDALEAAANAAASAHLTGCATCRTEVARLRALRATLHALPHDIAPPPHALAAIHERILAGTTLPATAEPALQPSFNAAPAHTRTAHAGVRMIRMRPALLAAAAIALMATSSLVTALLLPRLQQRTTIVDNVTPAAGNDARLVTLSLMETSYRDAIDELQLVLRDQHQILAPETVRLIQTNLDVIDRALQEARTALRDDPANPALADLLRANYERKLDVLRSATAHATSQL